MYRSQRGTKPKLSSAVLCSENASSEPLRQSERKSVGASARNATTGPDRTLQLCKIEPKGLLTDKKIKNAKGVRQSKNQHRRNKTSYFPRHSFSDCRLHGKAITNWSRDRPLGAEGRSLYKLASTHPPCRPVADQDKWLRAVHGCLLSGT